MRILYIEDDIAVARPVEVLVRQAGYDLDTTLSGDDAVDLAAANKYDLILLDNTLPDLDGYRFIGRMRGAGTRTPFLVQPYDRNEVVKEIEKVIGSSNRISLVAPLSRPRLAQPAPHTGTQHKATIARERSKVPDNRPSPRDHAVQGREQEARGPEPRPAAAPKKFDNGDIDGSLREWRGLAGDGDAEAQHRLAALYATGQGVTRDYAEAAEWRRAAAEQGHAGAQLSLAVMYKYGLGVPRDFVCAYIWSRIAAVEPRGDAVREAAIECGESVSKLMTPPQIAEAKILADEWRATRVEI